ncbi:MAG: hypothetical protein VW442_10845 [Acidimicrobiaceae bacterium]
MRLVVLCAALLVGCSGGSALTSDAEPSGMVSTTTGSAVPVTTVDQSAVVSTTSEPKEDRASTTSTTSSTSTSTTSSTSSSTTEAPRDPGPYGPFVGSTSELEEISANAAVANLTELLRRVESNTLRFQAAAIDPPEFWSPLTECTETHPGRWRYRFAVREDWGADVPVGVNDVAALAADLHIPGESVALESDVLLITQETEPGSPVIVETLCHDLSLYPDIDLVPSDVDYRFGYTSEQPCCVTSVIPESEAGADVAIADLDLSRFPTGPDEPVRWVFVLRDWDPVIVDDVFVMTLGEQALGPEAMCAMAERYVAAGIWSEADCRSLELDWLAGAHTFTVRVPLDRVLSDMQGIPVQVTFNELSGEFWRFWEMSIDDFVAYLRGDLSALPPGALSLHFADVRVGFSVDSDGRAVMADLTTYYAS